ncbi:hypothetical protein AMEX_G706 [Astyanax mexicanus]|uniref:Uncharacterized protein n=1 Tax=Astyanax mexicanus TaxID=7994 RepID=A0A8T2MKV5_ASTMX|nr:hypothetical protein AMEX_G706 [Astyanax mexicanus]
MELQQRQSVSPNVYEQGNEEETTDAKPEELYQCLQFPPKAAKKTDDPQHSASGEGKKIFLLLALITVLLTILLIISVVHYSHFQQTLGVMDRPITNEEVWHLRADVFYLFWYEGGDCNAAESFCIRRNASIATATEHNMAWLQSQTNGKQILVRRDNFDGSGNTDSLIQMDEDDTECNLLTHELQKQQAEGWVCGRAAK